jgi:hypothetical protein
MGGIYLMSLKKWWFLHTETKKQSDEPTATLHAQHRLPKHNYIVLKKIW